ncbi:Mediator of DNA damage checkpoint protein 1 [Geranomyces variabilis]|nr:Mediator of DNA damage checkpoint protein 1 [Geranomyces variabilis]
MEDSYEDDKYPDSDTEDDEASYPVGDVPEDGVAAGGHPRLTQREREAFARKEQYIRLRLEAEIPESQKQVVARLREISNDRSLSSNPITIDIRTGLNFIGSSEADCDIYIPTTGVSGIHAVIDVCADGIEHFVEDMSSTNGTHFGLHRYRLIPFRLYQLQHNQIISFDPAKFRYEMLEPQRVQAAFDVPQLFAPTVETAVDTSFSKSKTLPEEPDEEREPLESPLRTSALDTSTIPTEIDPASGVINLTPSATAAGPAEECAYDQDTVELDANDVSYQAAERRGHEDDENYAGSPQLISPAFADQIKPHRSNLYDGDEITFDDNFKAQRFALPPLPADEAHGEVLVADTQERAPLTISTAPFDPILPESISALVEPGDVSGKDSTAVVDAVQNLLPLPQGSPEANGDPLQESAARTRPAAAASARIAPNGDNGDRSGAATRYRNGFDEDEKLKATAQKPRNSAKGVIDLTPVASSPSSRENNEAENVTEEAGTIASPPEIIPEVSQVENGALAAVAHTTPYTTLDDGHKGEAATQLPSDLKEDEEPETNAPKRRNRLKRTGDSSTDTDQGDNVTNEAVPIPSLLEPKPKVSKPNSVVSAAVAEEKGEDSSEPTPNEVDLDRPTVSPAAIRNPENNEAAATAERGDAAPGKIAASRKRVRIAASSKTPTPEAEQDSDEAGQTAHAVESSKEAPTRAAKTRKRRGIMTTPKEEDHTSGVVETPAAAAADVAVDHEPLQPTKRRRGKFAKARSEESMIADPVLTSADQDEPSVGMMELEEPATVCPEPQPTVTGQTETLQPPEDVSSSKTVKKTRASSAKARAETAPKSTPSLKRKPASKEPESERDDSHNPAPKARKGSGKTKGIEEDSDTPAESTLPDTALGSPAKRKSPSREPDDVEYAPAPATKTRRRNAKSQQAEDVVETPLQPTEMEIPVATTYISPDPSEPDATMAAVQTPAKRRAATRKAASKTPTAARVKKEGNFAGESCREVSIEPPSAQKQVAPGVEELQAEGAAVRVMFTGISDAEARSKVVEKLHGEIVADWHECTHLVTDRIRRTAKFLCALSAGKHIVNVKWLDASKKAGSFVAETKHLLKDAKAEKQYGFNLTKSTAVARDPSTPRVFEGLEFFVTKSVKPPVDDMKEILAAAGAKLLDGPPQSLRDGVVAIGHPDDADQVTKLTAAGWILHEGELVLSGILKMQSDYESHVLSRGDEVTAAIAAGQKTRWQ